VNTLERNPRRPRTAAAFSLIEILIAVTVLSLGLLGLGMVFPVVVRQQRQAQDSIQGLSAARSAAEYLKARKSVVDALLQVGTNWYPSDGHTTTGTLSLYDGRWLVNSSAVGSTTFVTDRTTGIVTVGPTGSPQYIGISDRLAPAPFTGTSGPQFVWDVALRASGPNQVQAAVFTRRIDAGIRIPSGGGAGVQAYTLSHVLTGEANVPEGVRRVPVAVDKNGRPTLSGLDQQGNRNYSLLRTIAPANAESGDPLSLLRLSATDAVMLALARQPGQKLVDNDGVVHSVVRAADGTTNGVLLERALTELQRKSITNGQVQFLLAPQVPAAVTVVTLQK